MKKSMLVLTAALMFGGVASAQTAAAASAPQVPAMTDVPAGHWAKDAIDRLISKGIILGYPDGTYRGTQNLTRYEAAVIIARLLDQMNSAPAGEANSGMSSEDITALQNAVQELAADLAALGVRVSDLEENAVSKDDFSRLEARVEELAGMQAQGETAPSGDAGAIAQIQAQIDDLTARADDYDTLRADVDDNASSIAALNDLTVLLNQDILDLQDRVSAVEAAQADFVQRSDFDNLSGKVTAIDTRVTTLEKAPKFSVSGSIAAGYGRSALISGTTDFDITRLTKRTFGEGAFDVDDSARVTRVDTTQVYGGTGVRFGVKASNLTTTNGAIVANNAAINFRTNNPFSWTDNPMVFVNDASADGTIASQKFTVAYHRISSNTKLQEYLWANDPADTSDFYATRRGIIATIEATKLPLSPKITVVAGNTKDPNLNAPTVANANYWGVKFDNTLGSLGKMGVTFVQVDGNRSAVGTDADLKLGVLGVKGEAVLSSPMNFQVTDVLKKGNLAAYVEGRADLGVAKFGANYRAIDPAFKKGPGGAGMFSNSDNLPYAVDQIGYGAALGTNISILALGAYYDSSTKWDKSKPVTGFGVKAGAKFSAFEAVGFYNNLTVNKTAVDGNKTGDNSYTGSDFNGNNRSAGMDIAKVPFAMTNTFGGQLSHDGAASNALIKNLNFTVGDAYYNTTKTNSIYAYADYNASLGVVTLKPLIRFRSVSGADKYTVLKYGVQASVGTLTGVPLQPSLYANVAGRTTTAATSTSEMLAQAGLGLNNLIVDGASGNIGYAYYTGKNVSPVKVADGDYAFNSGDDRIFANRGTDNVTMNGLYGKLGWNGLDLNWGLFKYDTVDKANNKDSSVAQAFKVGYTFKF